MWHGRSEKGEFADRTLASTSERRLLSSTVRREKLEDQRSGSFGVPLPDHMVRSHIFKEVLQNMN
jgi:hypothetical protein